MDLLLAERPPAAAVSIRRVGARLADNEFLDEAWRPITIAEVVRFSRALDWAAVDRLAPSVDGHYQSWLAPLKRYADAHIEAPRADLSRFLQCVVAINFSAGARVMPDQLVELEQAARGVTRAEVMESVQGDPWLGNFLLNVWEYVHAVNDLTSYPWNVTLPVADLCNARCTFCTSWIEGKALVKLDQVRAFSEVIARAQQIGLIGHGEPLAHPQFGKICEVIAENMDPRSSIYTITNGVHLRKWEHMIDRVNLRSFSISLNAATAATHDEVMGLGPDAFHEVTGAIRDIVQRYGDTAQVYITMVVTQQNMHEVADFIRLGAELDVTGVWLRSLLPQSSVVPGLNYHVLAPRLHPEFERHRAEAVAAIAASPIPVQAEPHMWGQEIFTGALKERLERDPPAFVTREEALRDRGLRRRTDELYTAEALDRRGRAKPAGAHSAVSWYDDGIYAGTATAAWSYALSIPAPLPATPAAAPGRARVGLSEVSGTPGFGLLDKGSNTWIDRASVTTDGEIDLAFPAGAGPIELVMENAATDGTSSAALLQNAMLSVGQGNSMETAMLPLGSATIHNPVDPLDDGQNPFNRSARFACKAVYYNLYLNEMYFRIVPCCYMTVVPGFEEIRFDGSVPFMDAWNSPAMVELRRRLNEGPLFGACKKCAETW